MDTEQTLYLLLWFVLLSYIPLMILYYRARFIHPIKGRYPRAALVGACCSLATTTMDCFSIVFNGPCDLRNGFGIPCLMLWIDSINYRLVQLLFSYHIAKNISELKDKRFEDWTFNWFTRNRFLVQNKCVFSIGAVLLGINIFVSIYYVITSTVCIGDYENFIEFSLVVRLIFMCSVAGAMWKFSNDAFGMRSEFKLFIAVVLLQCIFGIMRPYFSMIKYYTAFLAMLAYQIMFFGSLLIPYYQSTKTRFEHDTTTLKDWLLLPNGVQTFSEYLRTEFSQENLFFYLEVEKYKNVPIHTITLERVLHQATEIWNKFVDRKAPYCVNLPHHVVELVKENMQTLSQGNQNSNDEQQPNPVDPNLITIFDSAQVEIYRLMSEDSFHRFQTTENYQPPSKREKVQTSIQEVEILIQNRQVTRLEASMSEQHSRSDFSPRSLELSPHTPHSPQSEELVFNNFNLEVLKNEEPEPEPETEPEADPSPTQT